MQRDEACCRVLKCVAVCYKSHYGAHAGDRVQVRDIRRCAVCRSVLQRVAACCSVLQKSLWCARGRQSASSWHLKVRSVLQCVAVCCSILQKSLWRACGRKSTSSWHLKVRSVPHCVAVCCSVLQCVQCVTTVILARIWAIKFVTFQSVWRHLSHAACM